MTNENVLKFSYEEITKEKKEKEISLPFYSRSNSLLQNYYKISAEDKMLILYVGNEYASITQTPSKTSFKDALDGEIISEEEFDNKFSEALEIINASNNTLRKSGYTKEQEEEILFEEEKKKFILENNNDRI